MLNYIIIIKFYLLSLLFSHEQGEKNHKISTALNELFDPGTFKKNPKQINHDNKHNQDL